MAGADPLGEIRQRIERCRACPRLVRYRERIAREGTARDGTPHWGRPIAGFGDPRAWLLVVGLAPAARGANRTGRVFTGDRSADFLVAGLHRAGLANQPTSVSREDGLRYQGALVTAAVRCVPPENRPSPVEARRCLPFLSEEIAAVPTLRAILALGGFAWEVSLTAAAEAYQVPRVRMPFAHGARVALGEGRPVVWGSYHPSPRNTQTGLFSAQMFDGLLWRIREENGPALRGAGAAPRRRGGAPGPSSSRPRRP